MCFYVYIFSPNTQRMLYKSNDMPPILGVQPLPPQQQQQMNPIMNPMPMPVPAPTVQPLMGGMGNNFAPVADVDLRVIDPRLGRPIDQDMRILPPQQDGFGMQNAPIEQNFQRNAPRPFPADPRQRPVDPRTAKMHPQPAVQQPPPSGLMPQQIPPTGGRGGGGVPSGLPNDASDQEKAALIMQVLQLSDEQIAMLPPEQRTSILVLKEQIAKSTGR